MHVILCPNAIARTFECAPSHTFVCHATTWWLCRPQLVANKTSNLLKEHSWYDLFCVLESSVASFKQMREFEVHQHLSDEARRRRKGSLLALVEKFSGTEILIVKWE
jgi:hypothetical protein